MKILTKGTYYGNKKFETLSSGIVLSEYDYIIPRTEWHLHENPYFMYVLRGNVLDINKQNTTLCPPGSLLLHNWDEAHCNTKESHHARGFHIEFERGWFENKKLDVEMWQGSRPLENPKLHHIMAKLYFEFKCQDMYSEVTIALLLLQLCEHTQKDQIEDSVSPPQWLSHLKQLLHDCSEPLSLQYLSKTLGVHPAHLSRAIPRYLHTTLGDYMRQQKIKMALGYLCNATLTLTEISYLCGFSDQSHFTRTFKMYFNKTPKEFRRNFAQC
ncbi:helix-turn-helix transcriptional regulator [Rasiella rasia]|uniref:Helix-turn-helix transcriptional regulator n=1 Tax=Rasiella rasia TaxID=2744027 RepID=A0A6G6GME5_9FLAO|nr:helix-turn-helix transcriptional regulator [Rasiella rasia]QIE59755.1 helix-turn-helix transcriptional regulator [Rasiella rasia]